MRNLLTLTTILIVISSTAFAGNLCNGTGQTYLKVGATDNINHRWSWEFEYTNFKVFQFDVDQTFMELGVQYYFYKGSALDQGFNHVWVGFYTGMVNGVKEGESGRAVLSPRGGFSYGQFADLYLEGSHWAKHNAHTNYLYGELTFRLHNHRFSAGVNYETLDLSGDFDHYGGVKVQWVALETTSMSLSVRFHTFTLLNGEHSGTTDLRVGARMSFHKF